MTRLRAMLLLCAVSALTGGSDARTQEPASGSIAFNTSAARVEARLQAQHASPATFLADPGDEARLRAGELRIEPLRTAANLPGAMLHHWRGTAFAPGAHAEDFERLMKNVSAYPRHFRPQVTDARLLAAQGDHLVMKLRVRQQHVLTVVLDTTYDVTFGRLDPLRGYSFSRSTQVSEIDAPGTPAERVLAPGREHGFLWRLNTYWSYEERSGGLFLQVESVSLTRSIPPGLAWAVQPFVAGVPRDSLEFTLRQTCNALRR